jgi:hypothetical protein
MSSDRVMVGIASIPERASSLERVLAALTPQADKIFVSLNGYRTPPAFLERFPNVEASIRPVNGGDAEKFAAVDDWDGYVATCDDDILYPADYIATLVAGIERYGRQTIVGFHGGKTFGFNGAAIAATHKQIRCLGELAADDTDVNVLGTGVLGFHTDGIPMWRGVFAYPNMADVHLACHAHMFAIPMVALAHRAGWLKNICPPGPSIYESNRRGDRSIRDTTANREAELARFDWSSPPTRPRVRISVATCQRGHLLPALLDDLERRKQWLDLDVAIYEDPARSDYTAALKRATDRGWSWFRFPKRLGREGHHQLVSRELADCRDVDADWFVFTPDDVRLGRYAIAQAIDTWQRLDDPATLTLWRLKDHEGQPNWTGLVPVQRDHAWEIFHVDGNYLCRRPTLECLNYRCPPIPANRRRATSSGVGRAMSLHLHHAGKRMYRVNNSLSVPLYPAEISVMNPDANDRPYEGISL